MAANQIERMVIIVIDGLGAGELPDAADYGDAGSDTLDNTSVAVGGLRLPNMESFGLGLIEGVEGIRKVKDPVACWGRMNEASPGKDTATGHWEMAGVILEKPFKTYPEGLPKEMLDRFSQVTGCGYLGGGAASGTEIIARLGPEHMATGKPIVYTSADSVFQIAAHEEVIPVEELYRVCEAARGFLDEYGINRVIARPFLGVPGAFARTGRRRDYAMDPPGVTLLEDLGACGVPVAGIGKIGDIFVHRGMAEEIHTKNDMDGMDATIEAVKRHAGKRALIFTNLVDFDTLYGHRNDPAGCARALSEIDGRLSEVTGLLTPKDILIITADHGCDPTTPSTDHCREYVPLLAYNSGAGRGICLGTRKTFADINATAREAVGMGKARVGTSFLPQVLGAGGVPPDKAG